MKTILSYMLLGLTLALSLGCAPKPSPDTALVAVATNFVQTAQEIETAFEAATAFQITLSPGASGQIYTQILNGAPYDIFLSADQLRPQELETSSHAVPGSRFTYASGALALWSPGSDESPLERLQDGNFRHLAMANPDLAPYGRAASEALNALGLTQNLRPKIVTGENIGQTFGLIATGNAELGFVAVSSLKTQNLQDPSRIWIVPQNLYAPIKQDAVFLERSKNNAAATAFLDYLKSPEAAAIMQRYGYGPS